MRPTITFIVAVTALTLFLIGPTSEVSAGTVFTVTKTTDSNDGTCDTDCSLREAIIAANTAGSGTITIPSGNYVLTIAGTDEDASATGDLDIDSNITLIGAGSELFSINSSETIIDGGALDGVFDVVQGSASLDISNVTIKNGDNTGKAGGIFSYGDLTLDHVAVVDNVGNPDNGYPSIGGVGVVSATLTMTDSLISRNEGMGEDATGGLFIDSSANATVTDSTLSLNEVFSNDSTAGALLLGPTTFVRSAITGNVGHGGNQVGGIFSYANTMISDSIIGNNTVENGSVAGIRTDGALTVTDSIIDGNVAGSGSTGGIYVASGSFSASRVLFSNNSVTTNATSALAVEQATANVTNAVFTGNNGDNFTTGGIFNNAGTVHIDFSTFADNTNTGPNANGAISNLATMTIAHTIIDASNDDGGGSCSGTNGTSAGYNIDGGTSCGFGATGDKSLTNPMLGPLADNGGPFLTYSLLPGSPAIDAVPGGGCPPPDTDARGVSRPQGVTCDIGAFEVGEATPTPSPTPTEAPGQEVIWGDNNCSGHADPVDALLTLRHDAGLSGNTGNCPDLGTQIDVLTATLRLWGDFDCSDVVDPIDALKLLRFDAGLSVGQNAGCPSAGAEVFITS